MPVMDLSINTIIYECEQGKSGIEYCFYDIKFSFQAL